MEESEVRMEHERLEGDRAATADGLRRAKEAAEASLHAKTARETELASARIELEWKSNNLRARERELAGLTARLASLTDLEAARAGYTEAARMVLAQANGHVGQQGSVADYLDVEPKYERAVEACLGDLLQHVIVPTHEQAEAGLDLIRQENVGRCGFVVLEGATPCRRVPVRGRVRLQPDLRPPDWSPSATSCRSPARTHRRSARSFPTASSPTTSRARCTPRDRRRRPSRR